MPQYRVVCRRNSFRSFSSISFHLSSFSLLCDVHKSSVFVQFCSRRSRVFVTIIFPYRIHVQIARTLTLRLTILIWHHLTWRILLHFDNDVRVKDRVGKKFLYGPMYLARCLLSFKLTRLRFVPRFRFDVVGVKWPNEKTDREDCINLHPDAMPLPAAGSI